MTLAGLNIPAERAVPHSRMMTRPSPRLRWLAALAALLLVPAFVSAITVIPPDFNQLVDEADSIFQGEVLLVHSDYTGVGANRHIATYVQFRVIRVFKGTAPNPQTLEIFGGTVGERTMRIPGLPTFKVGDNAVLFVKGNGTDICPLVGVFHGVLRVTKDLTTGIEHLSLNDGAPLTDTSQIGKSGEAAAEVTTSASSFTSGMSIGELGQLIQGRLAQGPSNQYSR